MKRWKGLLTLAISGLVLCAGGCKTTTVSQQDASSENDKVIEEEAIVEDEVEKTSTEDIYYSFIKNELVPELGIADLAEKSTTIYSSEEDWFHCEGILSAYIHDLDHDGEEELLMLFMEATDERQDYIQSGEVYHIVARVYAMENDTPVQKAEMVLERGDSDQLLYPSVQVNSSHLYVSAMETEDCTQILLEDGLFSGPFSDGMTINYWAIVYENEELHYAYQFVQSGIGSYGMDYYANQYQNGELVSSEIFYNADSENETYASYEEALKAFFEEQGLSVAYNSFDTSIFAETGSQEEILEFHIKYDFENYSDSEYTFDFYAKDATELRSKIQ